MKKQKLVLCRATFETEMSTFGGQSVQAMCSIIMEKFSAFPDATLADIIIDIECGRSSYDNDYIIFKYFAEETDEEYAKRIEALEKQQKKVNAEKLKRAREKEQKERELYEKLKKKYGS